MRKMIAILLVSTIVLAACGDDDDDTTSSDDTAASTSTAAPDTTSADTTVAPSGETADDTTGDTGDETGDAAPGVGTTVDVNMIEWEMQTDPALAAGPTEFAVTNSGNFSHEFVVIAADSYDSLPQEASGKVIEDQLEPGAILGRTEILDPGVDETLSVDLEPGNYVFICNIAIGPNSHAGAGQTLDVVVS